MLRLEALESKTGTKAEPPPGLPVNSAAPAFRLTALDGGTVTLDLLSEAGKPLVLVFSEPQCSMCDALLPDLAQWQCEFQDKVWIGLVSRGTVEAIQ
jgi:peroxiredoxin